MSVRSALGQTFLGDAYRSVRFSFLPQARARILSGERERIFTEHFHENHWLETTTRSGPGSTLADTEDLRRELPLFLSNYGVRTLLDIPCGDWAWMSQVDLDLDLYIGADIVKDLIVELRKRYGRPGVEFLQLDAVSEKLPEIDAILCRDLLIHLPNSICIKLLRKFRESGARWLLTTTSAGVSENTDILLGRYRPINLTRPPFNLPPPLMTIREGSGGEVRSVNRGLGIWCLEDVKTSTV